MDAEPVGTFIESDEGIDNANDRVDINPGSTEPSVADGTGGNAGEWINGYAAVEPTASGTGDSGSGTGKRRGRKPGSKNRANVAATQKASLDLSGIEGLLLSIHMMGAAFLNMPTLLLADDEAKKLAQAIAKVQAHYDIAASAKTLAWANLLFVAGGVYGPRIVTHVMTKPEPKPAGPSLVSIDDAKKAKPAASQDQPLTSPSAYFGVNLGAALP